jgi:uncharacterized protein YprB with RNaseH-like and TPR domain/predicted nuclease with RNAse H fold/dephospho-CoA kinase
MRFGIAGAIRIVGMIQNTFLHFKHISRVSELELWKNGILTWNDYAKHYPEQLSLMASAQTQPDSQISFDAFKQNNIDFFAKNIDRHEYFRLAVSFPEQVIFFDIETTGLSIYYDIITLVGWSIGNEYGVYINGDKYDALFDNITKAKIIITFNGTLFDLKFIKKNIATINVPSTHIDLRFFAKRVGLSGGQKSIEEQIGFKRKKNIEDIQGEAAPILWHKYRRGDTNALKTLIEYNHADIEGMKAIFDECVHRVCAQNKIPQKIRPTFRFSNQKSSVKWHSQSEILDASGIVIPSYIGSTKPLITYSDLNNLIPLDTFCVAGIDLVSSESRESGFCLLTGNIAETCRIKSDEDIITLILDAGANLVSIDSPLSLPKGRTTFWDDDPMREKYGITRECERLLKRRGISSYPCLIPSMQKLTQRGMTLAEKLRKLGVPVIESYPGAAQDIMNIPRKQAGLQYLQEGLREFGLEGNFLLIQVSHDELDAITSAIVGQFFWAGKFEKLGTPEEDYLIVPDLQADHGVWLQRKIIGLSGTIGTGKTTSAEYLSGKGYMAVRFSDVLRKILLSQQRPIVRSELQELGFEINNNNRQRWLEKQIINLIGEEKRAAVDGLRFPEDHAALVENFGPAFTHIHIESDQQLTEQRCAITGEEDIPHGEAMRHMVENEIAALSRLAHNYISNNDIKSILFERIDLIIGK